MQLDGVPQEATGPDRVFNSAAWSDGLGIPIQGQPGRSTILHGTVEILAIRPWKDVVDDQWTRNPIRTLEGCGDFGRWRRDVVARPDVCRLDSLHEPETERGTLSLVEFPSMQVLGVKAKSCPKSAGRRPRGRKRFEVMCHEEFSRRLTGRPGEFGIEATKRPLRDTTPKARPRQHSAKELHPGI